MTVKIIALLFAAAALFAEEYNFCARPDQTLKFGNNQRKCTVIKEGKRLAEIYVFGQPGDLGLLKLSRDADGLTLDTTEYFKSVASNPNLNLRALFDLDKLKLAENVTKSTLPNSTTASPSFGRYTLFTPKQVHGILQFSSFKSKNKLFPFTDEPLTSPATEISCNISSA